MFTKYEEPSSSYVNSFIKERYPEEEKEEYFEDALDQDRKKLSINSQHLEATSLYEKFQKHMNNAMTPDLSYFNSMKQESYSALSITIPFIEVYASRQHLEYINQFVKNLQLTTRIVDQ